LPSAEEVNGGCIQWSDVCGSACIARLLSRKGFRSVEQVDAFLRPRLGLLSDPFLLPQMDRAVNRIFQAIDRHEHIVLFGDYDVDGVTSLAILSEVLRAFGSIPELFLPLRMEEGYGLSPDSVERCLNQYRPELLIAVDCGTSSINEVAYLCSLGVDVIVLDHHEPKTAVPECVAVVNPKTDADCAFQYLCSAGVAFKLSHALLKCRPAVDYDLKDVLDLVALGTVADIVPLEGENRLFVHRGSRQLGQTRRVGVKKLLQVSAIGPPVAAEDIGYRLGPRLNAAGRLTTAEKALRLLLTRDEAEADALAQFLDGQNRERQQVEKETFLAAEEQIEKTYDPARHAAVVAGGRGWHQGVLGIVASRIVRKYHRPAIVIGFDETGTGKGSGRSIPGFSLVKALHCCREHLNKFGGHEMAAGLAISEHNLGRFTETFQATARQALSHEDLEPHLRLDHELGLDELNLEFLHWHEMLQPFGNGNPQPLFFARGVAAASPPRVLNDKHLLLNLRQRQTWRRALFFDGAAEPLPSPPWDIAFRVRPDDYDGHRQVGVHVQAVRTACSRS
jgi:single-stranded-DNA-specific exonuclease